MNKKLIAAAITAAVVAAPAAFAESVVYGKFHTSIDKVDFEDGTDNYQVNSRASRLGFKGSEDLGNGLKAIYQAEFSVQTDGNDGGVGQDGGDGWGGQRNTFIGLAGDWGTFLVGRHDTPAKVAFYAAGNERLGDSVIDLNRGNTINASNGRQGIGVFSEYRADNAIAYVSPSFGGFTVAAAAVPGEDGNGGAEDDGLADHWSVGAMFNSNGLKASVGYQSTEVADVEQEVFQVGASMTMNAFSIGAQYEDTQNYGQVDDQDYTAWALTGKFTFGNNAVSLVWTDAEADDAYDQTGWGLAAEHNFSKRTKVYAAYAANEVDYDGGDQFDDDVFSLGMIHDF